jgi:hypothetical protein
MKRILVVFTCTIVGGASALVANNLTELKAELRGFRETPSVSTVGRGRFAALISDDESAVAWRLRYSDLEGTITQAHIHFGDRNVSGGVSVWLCSNLASPPTPAGVQPCPPPPATISGIFRAIDVVGPASQGIAPEELTELIEAIRAGLAYANVHSTKFSSGEIRGQIDVGKSGSHHD